MCPPPNPSESCPISVFSRALSRRPRRHRLREAANLCGNRRHGKPPRRAPAHGGAVARPLLVALLPIEGDVRDVFGRRHAEDLGPDHEVEAALRGRRAADVRALCMAG
eukprot:5776475-Prymnesium_polylepis.1